MNVPKKASIIVVVILFVVTGLYAGRKLWKPEFEYAGTIEATRIDLPSRVPTVIKTILVNEGEKVEKGQILAELNCEEIALAAELAKDNYERAVKLKKTGSISNETFEHLENKLSEVQTKISWCSIKSPVNGTILTRFLEPAEWAGPGSKVLTVADLDHLWTYFYVPQEIMSKLKVGQKVTGVVPELDSRELTGHISKINDEAEFTPKNVQTQSERTRLVFGIKVAFDNEASVLKPGMTIESSLLEESNGFN